MGNICEQDKQIKKEGEIREENKLLLAEFRQSKAIVQTEKMALPLSTNGAKIVDSFGRRIKLCCYNLKGCHWIKACVSALEKFELSQLAFEIKKQGFNTVIIPFSLDLFYENKEVQKECLGKNIWMRNKKALDVLNIVINGLTRAGLFVILRNVCSKASYFKQFTESDGLWWNQKYPQLQWIDCLKSLTARYKHNPRVVGIQIRHTLKKTLNYEAIWGTGNKLCDWKRASKLACNAVLSQNPNILVIVPSNQRGDLRNISSQPLQLQIKNKLIFTSKLKLFSQKPKTYSDLLSYFQQSLNCIRNAGYPLLLATITDRKQSDWKFLINLLQQTDLDWGYSSYPKSNNQRTHHLFSNESIIPSLQRIIKSTINQQNISNNFINNFSNSFVSSTSHSKSQSVTTKSVSEQQQHSNLQI